MAGSSIGIGSIVGGLSGSIGGIAAGVEEKTLAARSRRGFVKGYNRGEAATQKEVYDILNSPAFAAARNFLYGTFGIGGSGDGGGAGTTFGGHDFNERPTGVALEGRQKKAANFLGKELAKSYNAKLELESGVKLSGGSYGEKYRKTLEKKVAQADQRMKALEGMNSTARMSVENIFSRYSGVTLDQGIKAFQPTTQEVGLDGQPAIAGGAPLSTNGNTGFAGGAGGPGTAVATAAPQYGPGFGFDSPLARDYRTALGQSQTLRGLYQSNAAASAEASGLAAFNFQQQMNLLPQLFGLAQAPSNIYQGLRGGNINSAILKQSGGAQGFGVTPGNAPVAVWGKALEGTVAGLGSGAAIGSEISQANQNQQYLDYLQNRPQGGGGYSSGYGVV